MKCYLLQCMSPELIQIRPPGMSAVRPLSRAKKTLSKLMRTVAPSLALPSMQAILPKRSNGPALETAWPLPACLHFGKQALGDGDTIAYTSLEHRRIYMEGLVRAGVAAILGSMRQCYPL